jgi:formyltetrahydrofolate synthetase
VLPVRRVRVSAGAGFVVPLAGDISTMPGLGSKPAALDIDVDASGKIIGLS